MPNIMGKVFRDHHTSAYNAVHGPAQRTPCVLISKESGSTCNASCPNDPAVHATVQALKKFHSAWTYMVDDIDKKRMTRTKTKKTLPKYIKELENFLKVAGKTPQKKTPQKKTPQRNTARNITGNAPKKAFSKKTMKKNFDPFVLFPKK